MFLILKYNYIIFHEMGAFKIFQKRSNYVVKMHFKGGLHPLPQRSYNISFKREQQNKNFELS